MSILPWLARLRLKKIGIKVAYVEAGLRSRDMGMPEEINRFCTDLLCDYLFTTDHYGNENLQQEGIAAYSIDSGHSFQSKAATDST